MRSRCPRSQDTSQRIRLTFGGESSGNALQWSSPFKGLLRISTFLAVQPKTTLKLFEQTGEVSPRGQPSRKETRCLSDADELHIVGLVLENPSMYLQEICQEVHHATGKQVSPATVCRLLARHGFTRKKIQKVAKQRCIALQAEFMAWMSSYSKLSGLGG